MMSLCLSLCLVVLFLGLGLGERQTMIMSWYMTMPLLASSVQMVLYLHKGCQSSHQNLSDQTGWLMLMLEVEMGRLYTVCT